jgi:hypothetical protein
MQGRDADALVALSRLHSKGNPNDLFVQTGSFPAPISFIVLKANMDYIELEDIKESIKRERAETRNA